ncbi:MAG TPA: phosphotransferase [Oscillospiraceae bacterium]|nr:phosphotransferase [Oscillospiraceae bacterium]HPF56532.1 phosphotransferase [Clostridiales bacterium]HPK34185.1 phosphotransferase [Oscillospiraceae bacterium]HPR74912.1 phosphotransferase [Oscillospiraceae bacterium]
MHAGIDLSKLPEKIAIKLPKESAVTVVKDKPRSKVLSFDEKYYLKITNDGYLQNEPEMSGFLSDYGLAPKVIAFCRKGENGWLLTETVKGDNTLNLIEKNPKETLFAFGKTLRKLHDLPIRDCPCENRAETMLKHAAGKFFEGKAEAALLEYCGVKTPADAYSEMLLLSKYAGKPCVIHGDACLPNLIIGEEQAKFIDCGNGGIGDRNYDLFWALWSIHFNLETERFDRDFWHGYGKSPDEKAMRLFGLISAFNGYRGRDYYRLYSPF